MVIEDNGQTIQHYTPTSNTVLYAATCCSAIMVKQALPIEFECDLLPKISASRVAAVSPKLKEAAL